MRALILDNEDLFRFDYSDVTMRVNPVIQWFYVRQYCIFLIGEGVNEYSIDLKVPDGIYFDKCLFHKTSEGWIKMLMGRMDFASVKDVFFLKFWDMNLDLSEVLEPHFKKQNIRTIIVPEKWDEKHWDKEDEPIRKAQRGYKPYGMHTWAKSVKGGSLFAGGSAGISADEMARKKAELEGKPVPVSQPTPTIHKTLTPEPEDDL